MEFWNSKSISSQQELIKSLHTYGVVTLLRLIVPTFVNMEEEETSVPRLLRLITVQLRELQSEVQDVRRDLSRLREVHKQSCSSVAEEEAPGETSRQSVYSVRHYSLGITLRYFLNSNLQVEVNIMSLLSESIS